MSSFKHFHKRITYIKARINQIENEIIPALSDAETIVALENRSHRLRILWSYYSKKLGELRRDTYRAIETTI